jgi:hypothetical protein
MRARHVSQGGEVKQLKYGLPLPQRWMAVHVGVWRCGLPIRWRGHTLPELLHHLTPVRGRAPRCGPLEMAQAVRIVRRICRLPLIRGPLFPQACLRHALALSYIWSRLGSPVAIHFSVYLDGEALPGTVGDAPRPTGGRAYAARGPAGDLVVFLRSSPLRPRSGRVGRRS